MLWSSFDVVDGWQRCKLDSLRWFSQRRSRRQVRCGRCVRRSVSPDCILHRASWLSKMSHFWGCTPRQGLWPPNSNSVKIFVWCICPQVSSSYVYSFGNYHVDKHTNPHTHPQTNRFRRKHPTFFATLRRWVISLYDMLLQHLSKVLFEHPT